MPVIYIQKSPLVGIWKIEELWQDMLESFPKNDVYMHDVHNINSNKRKQEWLSVRLLLKQLAGPDALIDYHENGAPTLKNNPYHISISHTTGFAAIILSKNENPGIDIEYNSARAWRLREKYLGEKELEMLNSLNSFEQTGEKEVFVSPHSIEQAGDNELTNSNKLATLCWCAKETAYKALQQTEVDFIDHLHILPFAFSAKGCFFLKETKTPMQQVFNINYQVNEDFIITWKE